MSEGFIGQASGYFNQGLLWTLGGSQWYGPGPGYQVGGQNVLGVFNAPGVVTQEWGGQLWQRPTSTGPVPSPSKMVKPSDLMVLTQDGKVHPLNAAVHTQTKQAWKPATGLAAGFGPSIGIGMTGLFMYQGYQEDGAAGALRAAYIDIAAGAGAMRNIGYNQQYVADGIGGNRKKRFLFDRGKEVTGNLPVHRTFMGSNMMATGVIGISSYMGAAFGADIAGPVGAAFGGLIGGRMGRSPLSMATSALVLGGGYMIGKGSYQLLKSGYRRKQQQKGLETAGSLAAFQTRNAATMRQRAVSAIHKSHLNARSALGMEATFMHRNTNYFSTYR